MNDQGDNADRMLSRLEAAAYLKTKGLRITPQTLANHAAQKTGPRFDKVEGNRTVYRLGDLDAWVASGDTALRQRQNARRKAAADTGSLADAVIELLPLVERAMAGEGTFADGVRFATVIANVKKALGKHR